MKDLFRRTPRYNSAGARDRDREVPENLWTKCSKCGELLYSREFEKNRKVCQKCGFHFRLNARERVALLADPGSFEECDGDLESVDPLEFVSAGESYRDKLRDTRTKTGLKDAVVSGCCRIEGAPVSLAVCDFGFLGASMGSVFGEKIARAAERAAELQMPLLTVSSSGGARMHEGILSLMQMAKTTAAVARLRGTGQPHLAVLADPCTGGVTASYVSAADVIVAEPGALIGFAGPRVVEQITKQKLPAGFQTAEFLLEHGMVDLVASRRELKQLLGRLLRIYGGRVRGRATGH